jgi:putative ABC transport system permease protein
MMAWMQSLLPRLRALFRKDRFEREMDEELRFHLEMAIQENTRAGMSPQEARRTALLHFGGVDKTKEECRDTRSLHFLDTLWQDLRYGIRMLRRNPGFTAAAVLTLGLGIGATTAIFTVINGVLLRPLPYQEPERLVYVKGDTWGLFSSTREYIAWKDRCRALSYIAAYINDQTNFTGGGEAERVTTGMVTASFFPLLGVQPVIGRSFLPEEDRPGGPPVAILSHTMWKRHFGGDSSALGRALTLDGKSYTVIGVLPPRFQIPDRYGFDYDLWMPLSLSDTPLVRVIGRLKPGVTLELARSELDTILQSTLRKGAKRRAVLAAWHEEITGGVKLSLLVFLVAVGFVLLIACVNVANLLLARAAVREREIVVRRALGAGKLRILRQLLTESVLMALLGGAAGLVLAFLGKDLLVAFVSANLPTIDPIAIDHRVLDFNLGLALITGLAFGLAPALQASGIQLNESLMEGGRGATEGHTGHRLRNLLVVSEIALAMVLLIGAGLLLKSFLRLRGVDPGFRTDHTLCLTIDLTPAKYPKPHDQTAFFQQVAERIRGIAGVQSVGLSTSLDLDGGGSSLSGVQIEGRSEDFDTDCRTVNSDYFRTLGIPLVKGRIFTESDREGMPAVAIVNESFARRHFPEADCVGKRVKFRLWMTIVGVVGDVRGYNLKRATVPLMYFSYLQDGSPHMRLLVRTAGDPIKWAAAVRSQIASVDKEQPPHGLMTFEQRLAEYLQPQRVTMLLLGAFAALALVLASVGIRRDLLLCDPAHPRDWRPRGARGAGKRHYEIGARPGNRPDYRRNSCRPCRDTGAHALHQEPALRRGRNGYGHIRGYLAPPVAGRCGSLLPPGATSHEGRPDDCSAPRIRTAFRPSGIALIWIPNILWRRASGRRALLSRLTFLLDSSNSRRAKYSIPLPAFKEMGVGSLCLASDSI